MTAEQALRALCAAWEQRDGTAVGALFAPDGRYEDPLFETTPVGPEEIGAACAGAIDELATVEVPLHVVLTRGDGFAIAEGAFVATGHDGRQLRFDLAMALEVGDAGITRFTEYFDTAALAS
jgi:ketosteroid isomerase-like protein